MVEILAVHVLLNSQCNSLLCSMHHPFKVEIEGSNPSRVANSRESGSRRDTHGTPASKGVESLLPGATRLRARARQHETWGQGQLGHGVIIRVRLPAMSLASSLSNLTLERVAMSIVSSPLNICRTSTEKSMTEVDSGSTAASLLKERGV